MITHRVENGDSLSGIAARYRVRPTAILAANPSRPRMQLRSGAVVFASLAVGEDIAVPWMLAAAMGESCNYDFQCDGNLVCCDATWSAAGTCRPSCDTKLPDGSPCMRDSDCANSPCVGASHGVVIQTSTSGICGGAQSSTSGNACNATGGTWDGSTCVCPAGYDSDGTSCSPAGSPATGGGRSGGGNTSGDGVTTTGGGASPPAAAAPSSSWAEDHKGWLIGGGAALAAVLFGSAYYYHRKAEHIRGSLRKEVFG